jgi:hypothetical protein
MEGGGREWLRRGSGMDISRRSDSGHDRISIMQYNNFHIFTLVGKRNLALESFSSFFLKQFPRKMGVNQKGGFMFP